MSERQPEHLPLWAAIDDLTELTEETMSAFNDRVTELEAKVDKLATDVQTHVKELQDELAAAKQNVADPTVLDGLGSKLDALDQTVAAAPAASGSPAPAGGSSPAASPASDSSTPAPSTAPAASAPADTSAGTSAPAPDPATVAALAPNSTTSPGSPAPAEPPAAAASATPAKTVYTFAGDPSLIDASAWPASGFESTDTPPKPLYYFSGDGGPGQTNGHDLSGGQWQVYTGAVQPVTPPASSPAPAA